MTPEQIVDAAVNGLTFYVSALRDAAVQPTAAAMLRFFCVVLVINGRWLMERLQRHLEGTPLQRRGR
jgi:hypothetical protein